MKDEGSIKRNLDLSVTVRVLNEPYSLEYPGVICANKEADESERIYEKVFTKKPIFLPDEYEKALKEFIHHADNFVFSMNGYSRITKQQCERYGIQDGDYEEACAAIMRETIRSLRTKFTGAQLKLIHGASDMGVDRAIDMVAKEFNIIPLGFSCPRYMLYVEDNDIPVYVASSTSEYADYYIRTLDLLIATGGREQALQHDVLSSCIYNKRIHFIDVLNSLSITGGVPATVSDGKGGYKVDNAAAAFGRNISFFTRDEAVAKVPQGGDKWDAIFANITSVATQVCRDKMSPQRKFR